MVAAFKKNVHDEPSSSEEESQESDEEDSEVVEDRRYGAIERTPCVVHTLQLVVNMIQKDLSVKPLLDRIRVLVRLFRKSSVAIQRLLKLCGLTLVKDCPTRWSSTYLMI
ncbi:putative AC transposase [Dissostichus eleginoides]|nr:putative AC transposase [Dissostichus eleginoides]